MDDKMLAALTSQLWPQGDHLDAQQVHWVLDGARDPAIARMVRSGNLEYSCLFSGRLTPRLQAAAPYIVHLAAGSPTTVALLRAGWGKRWGIFSIAPPHMTLTQQRMHFKKLFRVQTEDGVPLAFRFYDPGVLNVFLPTCTEDEYRTVMGPVSTLLSEEGQGRAGIAFHRSGKTLRLVFEQKE